MRLHDLVADPRLDLALVIPVDEPVEISWVHSTDMAEPGTYLSGGELVLTTGLWRDAPDAADRFVRSVTGAGIAALGYGVEVSGGRVPADLVAACRHAGLPLVRVPHELPFIEIARAFHAATTGTLAGDPQLRQSLADHELLARAAARSGGMAEFVATLASRLAAPVWVLDGPELTWPTGPGTPAQPLRRAWVKGRAAATFPVQATDADGTTLTVLRVDDEAPARCFLAYARPVAALTAQERRLLEDAVPYVRAELVRVRERRRERAARARDRLAMVETLGAATPAPALLDLPVDAPAVAIAFGYPAVPLPVADSLLDALPRSPAASRTPLAVVPDRQASLVLAALADGPDPADDRAAALVERLLAAAERQLDRTVHAGWTLVRDVRSDLPRALTAARRAGALAETAAVPGRIAQYERLGTHEVLLAVDPDLSHAYEDLVLGSLYAYDAQHRGQLVRTLTAFLERNCGYQSTATALGIHVNTLRYRLAAIEGLTGRDLRTMPDKVDLFLALRSGTASRGRAV